MELMVSVQVDSLKAQVVACTRENDELSAQVNVQ